MIPAPEGAVTNIGDGSSLQAFIDANGGKIIYIPASVYKIHSQLNYGVAGGKSIKLEPMKVFCILTFKVFHLRSWNFFFQGCNTSP